MRKLAIALTICLMLSGCASMTYTTNDGKTTTTVTYYRLMTGSDTIKAKIGDVGIETQGQKTFDPATLQAIFDILGKVK